MTKAKKSTKKAVKKAVKKVAPKKVVKKTVSAKKKTAAPVTKKVAKKPAKKVISKKLTAKKATPKKAVAKKVTTSKVKPTKKVTVKKKMIKSPTQEKSVIQPKQQPFKEDLMLTTTMDDLEIDVAPYEIEKGADYMTDEQLEHFRKILLRWKQQLMQEVDSTVGHMQEDGLSYPDPIDRASQEEGFNLELRTRDRERKLIKKIESAIDSIEAGEYGYCTDCGAEIGVRRLEARPTADKCIDCKTYEEIREKQAGGL